MGTTARVPASRQLRAAISIVTTAAADRDWGSAEPVRVRPGGLVQVGTRPELLDAATVYQAARGLVGALLDDLVDVSGRDLEEIVGPWLLTLELSEAVADVAPEPSA